jgi:hypothetical protein
MIAQVRADALLDTANSGTAHMQLCSSETGEPVAYMANQGHLTDLGGLWWRHLVHT